LSYKEDDVYKKYDNQTKILNELKFIIRAIENNIKDGKMYNRTTKAEEKMTLLLSKFYEEFEGTFNDLNEVMFGKSLTNFIKTNVLYCLMVGVDGRERAACTLSKYKERPLFRLSISAQLNWKSTHEMEKLKMKRFQSRKRSFDSVKVDRGKSFNESRPKFFKKKFELNK